MLVDLDVDRIRSRRRLREYVALREADAVEDPLVALATVCELLGVVELADDALDDPRFPAHVKGVRTCPGGYISRTRTRSPAEKLTSLPLAPRSRPACGRAPRSSTRPFRPAAC